MIAIILIGVCISVLLQIPRGLGDNVTYAAGSCISGSLNVILNVIFIAVLNWRVEGMLFATILAQGLAAVYIIFKLKIWKYIKISLFEKEKFIKLLKFSAPLIPNTFPLFIFCPPCHPSCVQLYTRIHTISSNTLI